MRLFFLASSFGPPQPGPKLMDPCASRKALFFPRPAGPYEHSRPRRPVRGPPAHSLPYVERAPPSPPTPTRRQLSARPGLRALDELLADGGLSVGNAGLAGLPGPSLLPAGFLAGPPSPGARVTLDRRFFGNRRSTSGLSPREGAAQPVAQAPPPPTSGAREKKILRRAMHHPPGAGIITPKNTAPALEAPDAS